LIITYGVKSRVLGRCFRLIKAHQAV
jgi:hypothetical protein